MIRPILACALLIAAVGWADAAAAWPGQRRAYEPACRQETPQTFVIEGDISPELAACVEAGIADTTREVVLNSPGGLIVEAARIADRLAGRGLTVRVRGHCASACATMLMPMARRIVVEPGALVMLHPGPDAHYLDLFERRRPERLALLQAEDGLTVDGAIARDAVMHQVQRDVTARYERFLQGRNIMPGWALWRTPHSETHATYIGIARPPARVMNVIGDEGWVLVEEPMLRSCLPGIEIEPYQQDLRRHWLRSPARLGLIWRKIEPSDTMVCAA